MPRTHNDRPGHEPAAQDDSIAEERAAWVEEHEWLLYALLHEATAVACTRKYVTGAAQRAYDGALKSLLAHTHNIPESHLPMVQDRFGRATIPYHLYAASRAKVAALQVELAQAKEGQPKECGWQPSFDANSPRQEELVVQFCEEIAGRRGQKGRLPDPVRLLEMAEALFDAERDHAIGAQENPTKSRQPSQGGQPCTNK